MMMSDERENRGGAVEVQCDTLFKPDWQAKVVFSLIARTIKAERLCFGGQMKACIVYVSTRFGRKLLQTYPDS
jgi:hypothetical protein